MTNSKKLTEQTICTRKYDLIKMRSSLKQRNKQTSPCGDPRSGEGYECLIEEKRWKNWVREYKDKQELKKVSEIYRCLKRSEILAIVHAWLDEYYSTSVFEFSTGYTGSSERRIKHQANWHLAALEDVLGDNELKQLEDDYCETEIKPKMGHHAYKVLYEKGGSEEEIRQVRMEFQRSNYDPENPGLSCSDIARITGRSICDFLLSSEPGIDRHIYYSEEMSVTRITIIGEERAEIAFSLYGYHGYLAASKICRSCPWEDPNLWKHLEQVLSAVCGVEIDLGGLEKEV
jgi:hypothetical protein